MPLADEATAEQKQRGAWKQLPIFELTWSFLETDCVSVG